MKILVAIKSHSARKLRANALTWVPRAGYNLRLFVSAKADLNKYYDAIDAANHDNYLDLIYGVIVKGQEPLQYAKDNGYDLLVTIPEGLKRWRPTDSENGTVYHFTTDLGKARVEFFEKHKKLKRYNNGARMVRV